MKESGLTFLILLQLTVSVQSVSLKVTIPGLDVTLIGTITTRPWSPTRPGLTQSAGQ